MLHSIMAPPRLAVGTWAVIALWPGSGSVAETVPAAYPLPERLTEAPILEARVAAGTLPPVGQRLPEEPLVLGPGDGYGFESTGRYGGIIRLDADGPTGVQAHLDAGPMYFDGRRLLPLVWKSCTPGKDKRVWTVRLHRGMKWSDGTGARIYMWWPRAMRFWKGAQYGEGHYRPDPVRFWPAPWGRHQGKANFLFVDGSVRTEEVADIWYDRF